MDRVREEVNSSSGGRLGGSVGGTKAMGIVVAQHDFTPTKKGQLQFKASDIIYVLSKHDSGWWDGVIYQSKTSVQRGWFPRNYVKSIKDMNFNRKMVPLGSAGGMKQRNISRDLPRNNMMQHLQIENGRAASTSGSRRGSLTSAGNLRRKSLSALSESEDVSKEFSKGRYFMTSISNASGSGSGSVASSMALKTDYRLDMSHDSLPAASRKPSFASSMNSGASIGSHEVPLQSIDPLQKPVVSTETDKEFARHSLLSRNSCQPINDCDITILSAGEVDMLFANLAKQDYLPLWTPVLTTNKNLLYYNAQLNVYCTSLPMTGTRDLVSTSVFAPTEPIVDLKERDIERNSGGNAQMLDLQSISSNSMKAKIDSDSESFTPPSVVIGSTASLTNAIGPSKVIGSNAKKEIHSSPTSGSQQPSTQPSSLAGTGSSTSGKRIIFSDSNVFHYHGTDLKTWAELKSSTIYFLRAAHNFFFKNNNRSFSHNLASATTLIFYYRLACKPIRQKLLEHGVWKDISRMHKRMIKLLFRINVNSIIYFGSSSKLLVTPNEVKRLSSDDYMSTIDASSRSSYAAPTLLERHDLRASSSSTMSSLNDALFSEHLFTEKANRTSETVHADPYLPRTSIPTTNTSQNSNVIVDAETGIVIGSLFNVIQKDFSRMFKLLNQSHEIVSQALEGKSTLPQIYPRFVKGSFDGNMWLTNNLDKSRPGMNLPTEFLGKTGDRFLHTSLASDPGLTTTSYRQYSNGSLKTFHSSSDYQCSQMSLQGKSSGKYRSYCRGTKYARYPLTDATLILLREKLAQMKNLYQLDDTTIANSIRQGKLVELTMSTYNSLQESTAFLNVIECLDLQFFLNLKNYRSNSEFEEEYSEFCESSMINLTFVLLEFYDLKQALHDITIRYVMDSQNLSARDPFVFCSMSGELSLFSKEIDFEMYQFMNKDKNANLLSEKLIMQDVEMNNLSFLNTSEVLCEAGRIYFNIATSLFQVIEQLIVERENIINYVARMMNNTFLSILLKDEQIEEDASIYYPSAIPDHRSSQDMELQRSNISYGTELSAYDGSVPFSFNRAFAEEVPWYLEMDFEHELVYTSTGQIKGGTKDALIEYLTNHRTVDASFNIIMLTTFRSMFSTTEFLSYLSERFDLYPPEGLSYEEYNIWIEKKQRPIKLRVINILILWLTDYWNDAYFSESLEELHHIVDLAILDSIPIASNLKSIVENRMTMREHLQQTEPISNSGFVGRHTQPSSKGPVTLRLKKQKLLDFEPFQFACQLTLTEYNLYSQINQFECLDRIWHNKFCAPDTFDNISNFITSSNHLTNFVSFCVIQENDIKKRVQVIEFFVAVSNHCYNMRNFSSMTAIVSGLYCSPVFRLKNTFQLLSKETSDSLSKLNTLMDSAKNFFRYRELLKTVQIHDVPCVPFFGVYLSDLTFTFTGNPDFLNNDPKIINFSKVAKIVAILNEIMSFQKITYKLKHFEDICNFLEKELQNVPSIEKQYEMSLKIEPRVDLSTTQNNNAEYTSKTDEAKVSKKLRFARIRK